MEHKTNVEFWHKKIERNIARDKEVNEYLKENGWTVFRFWGSQIEKELMNCIQIIEKKINEAKREKNI